MIAGDGPIRVNYIGYEEAKPTNKLKQQQTTLDISTNINTTTHINKQYNTATPKNNISYTSNIISPTYNTKNNKDTTGIILITIAFIFAIYFMISFFNDIQKFRKNNKNNYKQTINSPNNAFKRKKCLTTTETFFYKHLRKMIKEEYRIDPQIVISSIIEAKHYSNWNKINKKTVDFVIRDENLETILAIELDDCTHNYSNRIERDNFVNDVFNDAGIPLIRIKTNSSYENEIKIKIPEFLLK